MNSVVYKSLIFILIIIAFIGMSSYILLNDSDSICNDNIAHSECEEIAPLSRPLTSTGDFLGFYTTLTSTPSTFPIELVSFPCVFRRYDNIARTMVIHQQINSSTTGSPHPGPSKATPLSHVRDKLHADILYPQLCKMLDSISIDTSWPNNHLSMKQNH